MLTVCWCGCQGDRPLGRDRVQRVGELIEPWFCFSLVWTVGATCNNNSRLKFDRWMRDTMDAAEVVYKLSHTRLGWDHLTLTLTFKLMLLTLFLTLWRPLLPYWYSYKASCARPGQAVICNFWHPGTLTLVTLTLCVDWDAVSGWRSCLRLSSGRRWNHRRQRWRRRRGDHCQEGITWVTC